MHKPWLYHITGITGYQVVAKRIERHGRSREIRNAHVLARCGVLAVEELRSIYANAKTKIDAAGLFADWIRGASNASVEGFNNRIRWLIKRAYGYRDFKYFKLKIFDLPNLKSRDGDC